MTPGKLSKALLRRLTVSWREQLTQHEIDALEANIARVGVVVRVRWFIVAGLIAFTVVASGIYAASGNLGETWRYMLVPAVSLAVVLGYNAYYQLNYRRLGHVTVFNLIQLLLDIVVVSVLVYYSGGVYSWFTSVYLLFVLEAALILPSSRQVWAVAGVATFAYASVLAAEYVGLLPHRPMPFVANDLQTMGGYVLVRGVWVLTMLAGATALATSLMRTVRDRERQLTAQSILDERTGLYDRTHFRSQLGLDIERARRYRRGVSVVLADVDDMDRFNTLFGFDAGNAMLVAVADTIRSAVASTEGLACPELVMVARYGGEEFALLVPEDAGGDDRHGRLIGERLCEAVGQMRLQDRSVTVSAGVASYPAGGRTGAELMAAADWALTAAYAAGGNRCVVAGAGDGRRAT